MLAVSSLRNPKDENQGEMESFSMAADDFVGDFSDENLLENINFDDLFVGINDVGHDDILPDLEIFADFSLSGGEESELTSSVTGDNITAHEAVLSTEKEDRKVSEILLSAKDQSLNINPSPKEAEKGRKSSSAQSKNSQGKRKVKVDWTPELHRRFVQAVEQLGVDKAVPSRILEIMGIDCLTRHNIASHLQKYRTHRKHLLAREAEAASWSQKRKLYGVAGAGGGGGGKTQVISPWPAPTMGFPPINPMHHFRPLHVWGHPTMDKSFMHMWPNPNHVPPPAWAPPTATPPPPLDPSYWHQRAPNALTPAAPCFPQPLTTTGFASSPPPLVPGIPPHAMYKVDPGIGVPAGQPAGPRPLCDFHPSKESIDAVIGDVLSKPWLPLPLGLKAPALDSVMGELQRQGIPKIPPSCA